MSVAAITFPVVAFLAGGIPFGLLLAAAKGVNLRAIGSGNIGATNAARGLGMRFGLLTLLLDALKGFVPVLLARLLLAGTPQADRVVALTMVCAVAGHVFTPYLRLRGGKGVATFLGVMFAAAPWVALCSGLLYAGVYALRRISSLGSLSMTVAAPLLALLFGQPREQFWAVLVIAALVVIKHLPNIRRLLRGEEGRVSSAASSGDPGRESP